MLQVRFMKASPTTYVLHYKGGAVKREGPGLSFFYYAPTSTIVSVPIGTTDLPFVFNLITSDFQTVAIQGQLTYRITDAKRLAGLLDFSVTPDETYVSDDPAKLKERLINAGQVLCQTLTGRMSIRESLVSSEIISTEVLAGLKSSQTVTTLGLEVLAFSVLAVRPTPEMAKALATDAREALQRKADEAIYARRNASVEEERKIKESELQTEIAMEEKKRQVRESQMDAEISVEEKRRIVRETQMAAEISVEEQRQKLIKARIDNERKDAESKAYAQELHMKAILEPLKGADWKTLMAASANGGDPKLMIALAFRELAENAGKIGQLNITPDLLQGLLAPSGK